MSELKNPKHEVFAQGLAKGLSQEEAYKQAGYDGDRKNASRLATNGDIQDRVAELVSETTKAAFEEVKQRISFDAIDQFERLERDLTKAAEAGEWKAVLETRLKVLEMFGYRDHPTLTHAHVRQKQVVVHNPESEEPQQNDNGPAVVRFGSVARKYRKA